MYQVLPSLWYLAAYLACYLHTTQCLLVIDRCLRYPMNQGYVTSDITLCVPSDLLKIDSFNFFKLSEDACMSLRLLVALSITFTHWEGLRAIY